MNAIPARSRRRLARSLAALLGLILAGPLLSPGATKARADDRPVIGSIGLVDSPWGHTVYRGLRDGAAEAGVQHRALCHDFDFAREKEQLQELIAAGVDAIVMVPMREEASVFMISQAAEAGIPVLCVGICLNMRDSARYISAFYESDNYEVGYLGGAYLAQWLVGRDDIARDDEGRVRVGIVHSGTYGVSDRRRRGFTQALADADVPWVVAYEGLGALENAARQVTRDIVALPDIDIIWADNSENTHYALTELELLYDRTGRRVYFFGIELDAETALDLRDERDLLQAVSSQSTYELARRAMLHAARIVEKGVSEDAATTPGTQPPAQRFRHHILQAHTYSRDFPQDLDRFDTYIASQENGDLEDPPSACWQRERQRKP